VARRRRRLALTGLVVGVLGLQLVQPESPTAVLPGQGPIGDHVAVTAEVEAVLRESCYDCHSGQTRWPWYSHVSPVSWLLAHDVQHGRSNLDFDRWSTDPLREPTPTQRLRWMCREVREGVMPPWLYLLAHPGARLDDEETERLCAWTERALEAIEAGSEEPVLSRPGDGG
jgi:hypothetical protein